MTQPPLVIPATVEVPQAEKTTLSNGATLYTLASDDFEVLRITFVFRAGSAVQRVPFSASAAANMLAEGTRDMTAHGASGFYTCRTFFAGFPMRPIALIITVALGVAALSGCGQKGPLTWPTRPGSSAPASASSSAAPATTTAIPAAASSIATPPPSSG